MLGWFVSVYRQPNGGISPAGMTSPMGAQLAVWQTGLYGLAWLDTMVTQGSVIVLGGDGYPTRYTAHAQDLIPYLLNPPEANEPWIVDGDSILLPGWKGKTTIQQTEINRCRPEEWLLVEIWDES